MWPSTVSHIQFVHTAAKHTCGYVSEEMLDKAVASVVGHVYVQVQSSLQQSVSAGLHH